MSELEIEGQDMKELDEGEVALVSGAGFLSWLAATIISTRETSIPATTATLGIRG